jgi:hypothetical protein
VGKEKCEPKGAEWKFGLKRERRERDVVRASAMCTTVNLTCFNLDLLSVKSLCRPQLCRMPHNGSGNGATPILQRVGLAGAAARFAQRTYAADYIALGFLVAGWVLVSHK